MLSTSKPPRTIEQRHEVTRAGSPLAHNDAEEAGIPRSSLIEDPYCSDSTDELAMTPPRTTVGHRKNAQSTYRYLTPVQQVEIDEGYGSLELSPTQTSSSPLSESLPKISWTLEQRQAVCVLQRWYSTKWSTFGAIFKIYFAAHLTAVDKSPNGWRGAISAQWYDLKAGVRDDAWRHVFEETLFCDERGRWKGFRDKFEGIAATEGLVLERKCENKMEALDRGSSKKASKVKAKRRLAIESLAHGGSESQRVKCQRFFDRTASRRQERIRLRINNKRLFPPLF